jgi:hypothetical protein
MRRLSTRSCNDQALSETVSVTLMIILVIAVAAIIASIVFGLAIFYPKSAYIVVQTEAKNVTPNNWYLTVSHMNGDAAYLNHTLLTNRGMPVDFQFTTPSGATVIALPDSSDGPETWNPGDTLYVYNNSGLLAVTKNETSAREGTGLPIGVWRFDVVDRTDDVLIYTKNTGVGVPEPTVTVTIAPNTSVTTVPTTTITTTNQTTVPTTNATTIITTGVTTAITTTATTTVTTTPTPPCGTISGIIYNDQNGNGIPNWQVQCFYKQQSTFILVATTTTDSNGFYLFTGRQFSQSAEQYYVVEIPQSGWIATNPSTGQSEKFILNPDPARCYKTGVNFGNHYTG